MCCRWKQWPGPLGWRQTRRKRCWGPAGVAISALVMVSAFGAMNGIILAGPRVYYAMARDGLLFRWMEAVHPRYQSPHMAIAVAGAVVVRAGDHGHLSRIVHAGDLHGVDFFRRPWV